MDKDLKTILKEEMKARKVSTPGLSHQTGIPQDRIYGWYRDGTTPKAEDQKILKAWINGENTKPQKLRTSEEKMASEILTLKAITKMLTEEVTKLIAKAQGRSVDSVADELSQNTRLKEMDLQNRG